MRQHITNLYKFEELTEEGKQKAIDNNYDINVGYEWWEQVYEDAAMIGLKDEEGDYDGENEDVISEFLHDILEDYLVILRNEYEYLTSKEAIEETLIANGYEFDENGKTF